MQCTPWRPMLIGPLAIVIALATQAPDVSTRVADIRHLVEVIARLHGPLSKLPALATDLDDALPLR